MNLPSTQSAAVLTDDHEGILIRAILRGDAEAFEELFAAHEGMIYRCGFRMMGNTDAAADILQEVALKIFRHLGQFEGKSRFAAWVKMIAINQCRMTLRNTENQHRMESLDAPAETEEGLIPREVADWRPDPEKLYTKSELSSILTEALQHLKPSYREVFVLCDAEEYSMKEAAQVLGLSVAAVKTRLHRARLILRETLERLFLGFNRPPSFACISPQMNGRVSKTPIATPLDTGSSISIHRSLRRNLPRFVSSSSGQTRENGKVAITKSRCEN
jgi:RNA polymerase sigma-70 factor (ECF subfamily)